jgi:hypothetical protein
MTEIAIPRRRSIYISVRFKLLIAFTLLFTLIFAGAFYWFYTFSAQKALERLAEDLGVIIDSAVQGVNGDEFQALVAEGEPNEVGYSDDPRYLAGIEWLETVKRVDPRATTYTMVRGSAPNEFLVITDAEEPEHVPFRDPFTVEPVAPTEFVALFEGESDRWIPLEPYTDPYGHWISGYRAIKNSAGETVGVLGGDFPAQYYYDVQEQVLNSALPAFLITYAVLFVTVFAVATILTRRLNDLRHITGHIAEGKYEQDFSRVTDVRLEDEISDYGHVFEMMVSKVRAREEALKKQVQELRIEIDEAKQMSHVEEIVETDFFRDLQAKARSMRERKQTETEGRADIPSLDI